MAGFSTSTGGRRIRAEPAIVICPWSRKVTNTRLGGSAAGADDSPIDAGSCRGASKRADATNELDVVDRLPPPVFVDLEAGGRQAFDNPIFMLWVDVDQDEVGPAPAR
jgi:hypothetical protein